ncbi:hypothetical protein, partial [Ruminococcus callidus]|uniref:hypothetical protein n=1 Tax=Ruminococcus callidus TaxID=40519 RepID=UPI003996B36E
RRKITSQNSHIIIVSTPPIKIFQKGIPVRLHNGQGFFIACSYLRATLNKAFGLAAKMPHAAGVPVGCG